MNKLWETFRQKKGTKIGRVSISLLNKLADQLDYSLEQTQDYCLEIWKYFKSAPPDLEMILDAYERVDVNQAPPSWIAYSILVAGSQQGETPARDKTVPSDPRIETEVVRQIEKEIPKHVRINILKSYGLQRSSVLDQERVNPARLEHCPHGVPKGQVCCICNEKEFRNMTGIE